MPSTGDTADATERARLRWRCRRGMKELDLLLLGFLERDYPAANERERDVFARLLDLQDPELFGYLVGRDEPTDPTLRHVLDRIRPARRHGR
jgi:antitoxin CptB